MKKIDITKVKTQRNGTPVSQLVRFKINGDGNDVIAGVSGDRVRHWHSDGSWVFNTEYPMDLDLVEAKPLIKGWLNVYRRGCGVFSSIYPTRGLADSQARRDRLACIPIDVADGEGLI